MFRGLIFIFSVFVFGCTSAPKQGGVRCPSSVTDGATCQALMEGTTFYDWNEEESPLLSTAGFEVEGSVPSSLDYRELAEATVRFLEDRFPSDSVTLERNLMPWNEGLYIVVHKSQGWEYRYSFQPENLSIDPRLEPEIKPIEISAPIMRKRSQAGLFFDLIEDLRKLGLKSRPNVGGNHVHWGVSDEITYEDVLRLYKAVGKLIGIFVKDFSFSQERQSNIDFPRFQTQITGLEKFIAENPNTRLKDMPFDVIEARTIIRYVPELGTFELRIFNSNLNPRVNQFYFDFATVLFSEWMQSKSVFFDYLLEEPEPDVKKVISLMDLDWKTAEASFQWANERLNHLKNTLKNRSGNRSSGEFVFPTAAESAVEALRKAIGRGDDPVNSLEILKNQLSGNDHNIALYHFLTDKSFEALSSEKKIQVVDKIENGFQLMPYMESELRAVRALLKDDFYMTIGRSLDSLRNEDESLMHPLFFRLDQRFRQEPQHIEPFVRHMMSQPKMMERFLDSYSHYLRRRVKTFDRFHMDLLKLVSQRAESRVSKRLILRILRNSRFPIQDRQKAMVPELFEVLLQSIKEDRLLVLRLFRTVADYTRNDSLQRIGDLKLYIDVGINFLSKGNFPKLFSAWLEVLKLQSNGISEETLNELIFPVIYQAYKEFKNDASGMELLNVKWSVEGWKNKWTPDNWEKLKELIEDLK